MARNDDPRDLPLDPSEWERTELYREDDPELADALHEARTQILAEDEVGVIVSDVSVASPHPRRWRTALWIAAALAVGVGALMLADRLAGHGGQATATTERAAPAAAPTAPAAPAVPHPAALDAAVAPAAVSADPGGAAPDDATADIPADYTAAFQRHEQAVQRCLAAHAADTGDAERLTLRFDIGRDGSVASASVKPDSVARTALGACLVDVARAARFAPQAQPVGIRIPLALRRR